MDDLLGVKDRGANLTLEWSAFVTERSEPAFKRIYTHYYHYMSLIGHKRNASPDHIKDTINEIFLYAWENAEKMEKVKNHHNYLVTSFLRKLHKNINIELDDISEISELPESLIVPSPEIQHIYQNISNTQAEILKKTINSLPERQKMIIYQKFYLGLSYDAIAKQNGLSINTVYNTIYKAISNLKDNLGDDALFYFISFATMIIFYMFFFN